MKEKAYSIDFGQVLNSFENPLRIQTINDGIVLLQHFFMHEYAFSGN